jgi:hypothetical protein
MTLVWRPGYLAEGDPYFSNVSLLLHGNGTNGSTTIVDNSPSPKNVTPVGNAQISTAQSKFGGASIAFDGTGDYLTTPVSAEYTLGATGDFTVEFWIFPDGSQGSNAGVIGNLANWSTDFEKSFQFVMNDGGSGGDRIRFLNSSGTSTGTSTGILTLNGWNHVAAVRVGSTITLYVNGVSAGSQTTNQDYSALRGLFLGLSGLPASGSIRFFKGYLDEVRITKGVARYTSNFTPPDAPFPDAQY